MEKVTKEQVDEAFNGIVRATGEVATTRENHNKISQWLQVLHRLRDEHFAQPPAPSQN